MASLGDIGSAIVQGAQNIAPIVTQIAAAGIIATNGFANNINPLFAQSLTFPNDLITDVRSIYMNIYFMSYQRFSIFTPPTLSYQSGIQLPIPMPLVDAFHIEYTEEAFNSATVTAAINGALSSQNGGGLGGFISGGLLSAGAGPGADLAGAFTGVAPNPMLTVLFKSPSFKTHTFSWKFAPRSPDETSTVQSIINQFKYNMLPGAVGGITGGGTLLSYPNLAIISIQPNDANMYQFMPCVVTDVQSNYAPLGPSFLNNSYTSPTIIEVTITLKEVQYWLNSFIQSLSVAGTVYQTAAAIASTVLGAPNPVQNQPTSSSGVPIPPSTAIPANQQQGPAIGTF